jgi:CBS domain-containing protein
MTIKDIMQRKVIKVEPEMPVADLAAFLTGHGISGAPVTEGGKLVGVVSLYDIVASGPPRGELRPHYFRQEWMEEAVNEGFTVESIGDKTVRDIMNPAVYSLGEDASLNELVEMMLKGRIHRVIITRNHKLVGIVTTTDLVRLIPLILRQPALS